MSEITCASCSGSIDTSSGTPAACPHCGAELPRAKPRTIQPLNSGTTARPHAAAAGTPSRTSGAARPRSAARPAAAEPNSGSRRWLIIGGVVLAIAGLLIVLTRRDPVPDGAPEKTATQPVAAQPEVTTPPAPTDPLDVARMRAEKENTAEAWSAYADLCTQRADAAKGTPAEDSPRAAAQRAWQQVLKHDKDHTRAHAALGHVLLDPAWLSAAKEDKVLSDDLKGDLEIAYDELVAKARLDGKPRRVWLALSSDAAVEWKRLMDKAETARTEARNRAEDPFQREASSMGESIAAELDGSQVSFLRRGVSGEAFSIHVIKPYVLLVQRDASGMENKIAEEWGDVLLSLQATFYPMLSRETGATPPRNPIPVLILRDSGEYTKYLRRRDSFTPVTSGGHYEPWSNRLVVYKSLVEQERETLFHEGTHQLVEAAMKTTGSDKGMRQALWFSEGIADYFGGHAREWDATEKRWRYVPGTINPERIDSLVKAKERGSLFTLAELLEYRRFNYVRDKENPQKSDVVMNAYAQGWGLCYLLANWKDGKYREDFIRYVKAEFEGNSGRAPFEKIFGKYGVDALEKEFLTMIDELGAAKKEGRILDGKLLPPKK